jgi:hypothetical protein
LPQKTYRHAEDAAIASATPFAGCFNIIQKSAAVKTDYSSKKKRQKTGKLP